MTVRRPIIAIVAFLLLAGVYNYDRQHADRAVLRSLQRLQVLFQVPSRVEELTFDGADGKVLLRRDSANTERWKIVEPREAVASQDVVAAYLENLRGARRQSEFPLDDPARYGLDKPQRKVTVVYTDEDNRPQRATILFGHQPTELGPVYAAIEGEGTVFTISEWFLRNSSQTFKSLRDHTITQRPIGAAQRIDIENINGRFSIERSSPTASDWQVTRSNGQRLPADRVIIDRVLGNLSGARFAEYLENTDDLDTGLDRPFATLRIDGEEILALGIRVPDKEQIYALTDTDEVAVVGRAIVGDLFRPATEWGTKRFIWFNADEIVEVKTSSGNSSLHLEKVGSAWQFAEASELEIRQDVLRRFLDSVTTLSARIIQSEVIDEEKLQSFGFVDGAFRLSVKNAAGEEQSFRFGRTDTRDGLTYVLREHDMSLWRMDFALQRLVFLFQRDLEDRRFIRDLDARVARVSIRFAEGGIELTKSGGQWRGTMPDVPPTLVPEADVLRFLESFEEMQRGSEEKITAQLRKPGEITFGFYEQGAAEPFAEMQVVSQDPVTKFTTFQWDDLLIEVPPDDFSNLDDALVNLVLRIKGEAQKAAQAEEE